MPALTTFAVEIENYKMSGEEAQQLRNDQIERGYEIDEDPDHLLNFISSLEDDDILLANTEAQDPERYSALVHLKNQDRTAAADATDATDTTNKLLKKSEPRNNQAKPVKEETAFRQIKEESETDRTHQRYQQLVDIQSRNTSHDGLPSSSSLPGYSGLKRRKTSVSYSSSSNVLERISSQNSTKSAGSSKSCPVAMSSSVSSSSSSSSSAGIPPRSVGPSLDNSATSSNKSPAKTPTKNIKKRKQSFNGSEGTKRKTAMEIFHEFIEIKKDQDGRIVSVDPSGIFTRPCFEMWWESRRSKLKNPEEAYRKSLISYVSCSDGASRPFAREVEAAILRRLRQRTPWPCFEGRKNERGKPITIGSSAVRVKGHWEKIDEEDAAAAASESMNQTRFDVALPYQGAPPMYQAVFLPYPQPHYIFPGSGQYAPFVHPSQQMRPAFSYPISSAAHHHVQTSHAPSPPSHATYSSNQLAPSQQQTNQQQGEQDPNQPHVKTEK